jgi:hypothetical protein
MDVDEICEAGNPHSSQLSTQELIGISVSYRFRRRGSFRNHLPEERYMLQLMHRIITKLPAVGRA